MAKRVDPTSFKHIFDDPTPGEQLVVNAAGMKTFFDRVRTELPSFQYERELIWNEIEAILRRKDWRDAEGNIEQPRIEIHPDWIAAGDEEVLRYVICGNGNGFETKQSLIQLAKSIWKTGNAQATAIFDGNYGWGGRLSTVYWNHYGIIIASWHKGEGWMVRLRVNPVTLQIELFPFPIENEDGEIEHHTAIRAPEEYKYDVIKDFGTSVILLGMTGKENTFFGPIPDERLKTKAGAGRANKISGGIYSHHKGMNQRFWEFPKVLVDGALVDIQISVFTSTSDLKEWPRTRQEARNKVLDGKRSNFWRLIHGFKYYQESDCIDKGVIDGDDFKIHWYLHSEEKADNRITSVLRSLAQIGVLCKEEIYENELELQDGLYNKFGIYRNKVKKRVSILIEPRVATDSNPIGISPNGSRTKLMWNGEDGDTTLPMDFWAECFERNMPEAIKDALKDATNQTLDRDINNTLEKVLMPYMQDLKRHYYQPKADGASRISSQPGQIDTSEISAAQLVTTTTTPNNAVGPAENEKCKRGQGTKAHKPGTLPAAALGGDVAALRINRKITLPKVELLTAEEAAIEGLTKEHCGKYIEEKHVLFFNKGWSLHTSQIERHVAKHKDLPGVFEEIESQVTLYRIAAMIERVMEHYKRRSAWAMDIWRAQLSPEALTFACSDQSSIDTKINLSLGQKIGKMARSEK